MEKTLSVRINPELLEKLSKLAEVNQRSMAGQLRWLIASAEITQSVREKDKGSENSSNKIGKFEKLNS